jgi:GR25 family glycosyltransferase involved in LPS biosynthesis
MAAMTDLKLTWMNAWTMAPTTKALPHEHNPGLKDVEYACWRTHADAWRRVVEEGWATTMIMEDDADWDGSIHQQMALAWKALNKITKDPNASTEAKSYFTLEGSTN